MEYVVLSGDDVLGRGRSPREAIQEASLNIKVPIDFPIASDLVVENLIEQGDLELRRRA